VLTLGWNCEAKIRNLPWRNKSLKFCIHACGSRWNCNLDGLGVCLSCWILL
jgi:hypothetical protein